MNLVDFLGQSPRRWRLAGAEHGSRVPQRELNPLSGRVRPTENAPREPFNFFERRHGLAEIVERGAGVLGRRGRGRGVRRGHEGPDVLHLSRGRPPAHGSRPRARMRMWRS